MRSGSGTVQWNNQSPITITYTNDDSGLLTGLASSTTGGTLTGYTYDELNRRWQVNDAHSGVTAYSYDAVGNLQSFTYANGVWHSYQYDAAAPRPETVKRYARNRPLTTVGTKHPLVAY